MKNWGTAYPYQNSDFANKVKQTIKEKYGVENYSLFGIPQETYDLVNDRKRFSEELKKYGVYELATRLHVGATFILKRHQAFNLTIIKARNKSSYELEIATFLRESNFEVKTSDRTQIKPYELDFYLPEYKVAIEFQGDYWHMNPAIFDANEYHKRKHKFAYEIWAKDREKAEMCSEKGISLIPIWESDWNYNKTAIKQQILELSPLFSTQFALK